MSTCITVAVVPHDILPRPFLKSSCIITHTSFSPLLHPHTRIFSLSTQPQETAPVTTTTTTTTTTRKSVAIYLKEKLGFSQEQSLVISKTLIYYREDPRARQVTTDFISFEEADNVIGYLHECGLDISHVKKIVSKYPLILTFDVDKTLKPKIKLLQELRISTSDLAHVLYINPRLYLESDLTPAIQALRGIMGSEEDVVKVLKGYKRVTGPTVINNMIPNVNMLENEYGIPRDKIRSFMPRLQKVILARTDWLRDVLVRVEDKWGIRRDSTVFMRAVHVFSGLTYEIIDSKCQVFRSYGWSESDILSLIKCNPYCLAYSEARMRKYLEFFKNELRWSPAYLISRPVMFNYSLENRVVPRYRILSILKERQLVKAKFKLYNAIAFTDAKFFDRFILPYQNDVPEIGELYMNGCTPDLPADN